MTKIYLAIIILLVAYAAFIFVRVKYILRNTNLPEITQSSATLGQGSSIKYIAIGDSTAVGVGASTVGNTYTYRIAQHLSQSHTVDYRNIAVSGAKTRDLIDTQLAGAVAFQPDIITISVGANDVTHLKDEDQILANIQTILETLTAKTDAQIFVANIPIVDRVPLFPYPVKKLWGHRVHRLNSRIIGLNNDRVHVVDIHEFGWNRYPDIRTTFAKDQFHPNDEGYNNWTNAFLTQMDNANIPGK